MKCNKRLRVTGNYLAVFYVDFQLTPTTSIDIKSIHIYTFSSYYFFADVERKRKALLFQNILITKQTNPIFSPPGKKYNFWLEIECETHEAT